jgi:hypothetical protein
MGIALSEDIAGTVMAEDRTASRNFAPMDRIARLQTEAGEQRARADALDQLAAEQQLTIHRLRSELEHQTHDSIRRLTRRCEELAHDLATLKGENATPQRGCQFFSACVGEATVLCEYEYSAAEAPIYDADHPGVGPGHDADLALIQVLINGQWCDPTDFMSEAQIERIEQQILEAME